MSSEVNSTLRRLVAERAYHVCEYCLIHEADTFWGCQMDHIISRRHAGTSTLDNLALACFWCNNRKGTDVAALVGKPPHPVRFFHPRDDRWATHLALHQVRIEPHSEVGEATAKHLSLNEPARLEERFALAEAGRYPTIEAMARMKE